MSINEGLRFFKVVLISVLLVLAGLGGAYGQGKLDKKISLSIHQRTLAQTLTEIGRKGGFVFSYNTNILKGDSLVDIEAEDKPVRHILEKLLGNGYDYSESGKYVILLARPNAPPIKLFTISGFVLQEGDREKVVNASVYESDQLVSTLTDTNGFFRLRLKDRNARVNLVVSKQFYRDTVIFLRSGYDQQFTVLIGKEKVSDLTPIVVSNRVERTWLGHFFLSSRAIVQSLNLINFFADKPIQFSLTPGLGTHGRMSSQVVNKLSLNLVGGYSAGMNGVELAGVFNIDRKDVRYVQAAGIANVVGGAVTGVQLAGIHNHDLDSVRGVQAAGISNVVKGDLSGVQLAGVVNIVGGCTNGVQAGIVNYTKKLKGLQIGVVNIADSSSGVMIGLVNIVRKNGIHEFSLSSSELLPYNLSYKTGNRHLYSILQLGFDAENNEKAYGYGIGIGNELRLSSHWAFNTEFLLQNILVGHGYNLPVVERLQGLLRFRAGKTISFFAGPSVSLSSATESHLPDGYKMVLPRAGYHRFAVGQSIAWVGWTAGISIF